MFCATFIFQTRSRKEFVRKVTNEKQNLICRSFSAECLKKYANIHQKTKEKDVKTCTRNENTNILSCSVLSLTF